MGAAIGMLGAVATIGGAAMQVVSAMDRASQQRKAAKLQRQQQAHDMALMEESIKKRKRANRIRLAEIRDSFGMAGIGMAGSPLLVLQDSAMTMAEDIDVLRRQKTAQGFRDRVARENQAQRYKHARSNVGASLFGVGSAFAHSGADLLGGLDN